MKRISQLARMAALLLTVVACGKNGIEVFNAPDTQERAGIIATCTTVEKAQEVASKYGVNYRVISKKSKMIEFYGLDQETILQENPKAKLTPNKVFGRLIDTQASTQASSTNYPYYGPHSRASGGSEMNYFTHLSQIDALNLSHKGEGVIIAIVDTGVYYNHPHLSPNILTNERDKHGDNANGIDDDGNRYVDDYVGWDFYNGDAYPIDDNGHGTHVAGLAAGVLSGVAPRAKILPVKVMSSSGQGDIATIAAGILYAIERGAHIINLSVGGPAAGIAQQELQRLLSSVRMAKQNNSLLVAAAGNGGQDGIGDCNDAEPMFPSAVSEDNILSVAAVDNDNQITSYSNYGTQTVDVAAPGGDGYQGLLSTGIPYCYGPCSSNDAPYVGMSGTSMATPVVAGVAAVLKSKRMQSSFSHLKNIIMNSGTDVDSLTDKVMSGKVVNAAAGLRQI